MEMGLSAYWTDLDGESGQACLPCQSTPYNQPLSIVLVCKLLIIVFIPYQFIKENPSFGSDNLLLEMYYYSL